jgi:DNA repair protein RadC
MKKKAQITQTSFIDYEPVENLVARLPVKERPVNRLCEYGANALSTMEVLATIIGGANQIEVAQRLLSEFDTLAKLARQSVPQLQSIDGIGRTTAATIKAALELGKRLVTNNLPDRHQIRCPADCANLLMAEMQDLDQEHLRILVLDTKNRIVSSPTVYIGNLNTSIIRVGEMFRYALRENGASVIIAHNHPSGDPTPSPEDVQVTERMIKAGKMLDIEVLDHLIIGRNRFVSLKERRLAFS